MQAGQLKGKNFALYRAEITKKDIGTIDVANYLKGFTVSKNIGNKFTIVDVQLDNQFFITQETPFDGSETFILSYSDAHDGAIQTFEFFISEISAVVIDVDAQTELMRFRGISTNFLPFIEGEDFMDYQKEKTPSEIMDTIFSARGISLDIDVTDKNKINYLPNTIDPILMIDYLRFAGSTPSVVFEREGVMYMRDYKTLLRDKERYFFDNYSIITEQQRITALTDIEVKDFLSRKTGTEEDILGYQFLDYDIFKGEFTKEAIDNKATGKLSFTTKREYLSYMKNCRGVEDRYLSRYVRAKVQIPTTEPLLGRIANLKLKTPMLHTDEFLATSGDYIIYGVLDMVDNNFDMTQTIQFISIA